MSRSQRARAGRSRRAGIALSAAVAGAALLTSCSDDSSAATDGATVIDVSLGRFVIEPATLNAPAGDLVLNVTNDDPELEHDLVVYGKGTRRLAPGESQTLEVPGVAPGDYRMWCDVPGHAAAGQVGQLSITPAAASTTATS